MKTYENLRIGGLSLAIILGAVAAERPFQSTGVLPVELDHVPEKVGVISFETATCRSIARSGADGVTT